MTERLLKSPFFFSRRKLRQIFSPTWMYLHLQCLTPLITYDPYPQLCQKTRSIEFQLILGLLGCLCKALGIKCSAKMFVLRD